MTRDDHIPAFLVQIVLKLKLNTAVDLKNHKYGFLRYNIRYNIF